MKITDFNKMITEYEGKKKNIDIAQVSEIVRIVNVLTENALYSNVKALDEKRTKTILKASLVAKTTAKAVVKEVKSAAKKTLKTNAGKNKKA